MQRYIFSPTPPSISQILSYILPLMINFILPQIPDYFHAYSHPLICKQLLPKQQKICENPCNLWENKSKEIFPKEYHSPRMKAPTDKNSPTDD